MLTVLIPDRGFAVGQSADVTINGELSHAHWRDPQTLLLDGDSCDITRRSRRMA